MAGEQRFSADVPLRDLVDSALAGSQPAWDSLVHRLERVVWKAVNMMTYDPDIRADAFGATWLRLAERLDSIREPEKLPGWLTTTACNEVRHIVRRRGPAMVAFEESGAAFAADDREHVDELILGEQRVEMRRAFGQLDDGCRELLTVLVLADPPVAYDEAASRLGRPIGSLGPSRRRCLDKLEQLLDPAPGSTS